jgi:hypothetical protein
LRIPAVYDDRQTDVDTRLQLKALETLELKPDVRTSDSSGVRGLHAGCLRGMHWQHDGGWCPVMPGCRD